MRFFEYPYVIITILVIVFVIMGLVGLYFTLKSMRAAKGTEEKNFCGISKIKNEFVKLRDLRKQRCIMYVSISLDGMKRLCSETRVIRMYEQIKSILLKYLCIDIDGNLSVYDQESFVALNELSAENAAQCLEICFSEIKAAFVENDAVNVVRVNCGYHCTSSTVISFKTALERAKQACSMAEDKGILHCQWDSANGKAFERKIKIENNIQNEIDNNHFFLQFQPILDAKTNRIVGAEVLSRLNTKEDGVFSPNYFIPAINTVGVNDKFDYYILEKNCKWISCDREKRAERVYTINFSRSTLCNPNFVGNVVEIIEKYGLDYSCIAVEILEDKTLSDYEKSMMMKNLKALREKGVLILLDDFGKGYTSFSDLADFAIDIVKIDKAVTQNVTTDTGYVILKNIIRTAHDLGFKTLCECIETEEQKNIVVNAGCDMLQGYYFYRPMPVTQFEAVVEQRI